MKGLAVVLVLALAGCSVGPAPGEYAVLATSAHGATGTIGLRDGSRVQIELIAVTDDELIVLTDSMYARIPLAAVRSVDVSPHFRRNAFRVDGYSRNQLRQVSRFPHGITDEVRRTLLGSTGPTELHVLGGGG